MGENVHRRIDVIVHLLNTSNMLQQLQCNTSYNVTPTWNGVEKNVNTSILIVNTTPHPNQSWKKDSILMAVASSILMAVANSILIAVASSISIASVGILIAGIAGLLVF